MLESVCDMLLYCSFCNENFGTTLLKQLMVSNLHGYRGHRLLRVSNGYLKEHQNMHFIHLQA